MTVRPPCPRRCAGAIVLLHLLAAGPAAAQDAPAAPEEPRPSRRLHSEAAAEPAPPRPANERASSLAIDGQVIDARRCQDAPLVRDERRARHWLRGDAPVPAGVRPQEEVPYLVCLNGKLLAEAKEKIESLGGKVISSDAAAGALLARLNAEQARSVQGLAGVAWLGWIEPREKLSAYVEAARAAQAVAAAAGDGQAPADAEIGADGSPAQPPGPLDLVVVLYPGEPFERTLKTVEDLKGTVRSRTQVGDAWRVRATLPASQVESLAALPEVRAIEVELRAVTFNDVAGSIIGIPDLGVPLDGRGQIIGHADTGIDLGVNGDPIHSDLAGRIGAAYSRGGRRRADGTDDWSDPNGHGTHTAATLVGSGAASGGRYRGIAPGARLIHQSLANARGVLTAPPDLRELLTQAYAEGAKIHSNSWGYELRDGSGGHYNFTAEDVDAWAWNHGQPRDMLIVYAAGNHGPAEQTIVLPATAKNSLTVGAVGSGRDGTSPDQVAERSSRGPTQNGRIKPDLVAPGAWIASARTAAATTVWESDLETPGEWDAHEPTLWASDAAHSGSWSWHLQQPAGDEFTRRVDLPPLPLPASPVVFFELSARGEFPPEARLRPMIRVPPQGWRRWPEQHYVLGRWSTLSFQLPQDALGRKVQMAIEILAADRLSAPLDLYVDDVRLTTFANQGAMSDLELAGQGDDIDRLYTLKTGTSMATPVAAGAAALVREYLEEQERISPTAELLKALLINGAERLGAAPDPSWGWGRLDLRRTLPRPPRHFLYNQDDRVAAKDDRRSTSFEVTGSTEELRITVVWCDPPGAALRNDLDMVVYGPDGTPYFPFGATRELPDRKNNVEGIDLRGPAPGRWRVEVTGAAISEGPQPYALVVSGAVRAAPPV